MPLKILLLLSLLLNTFLIGYLYIEKTSTQQLQTANGQNSSDMVMNRLPIERDSQKHTLTLQEKEEIQKRKALQSAQIMEQFNNAKTIKVTWDTKEVEKALENLPKVLQGAKAVPYVKPNSRGEISGFKIVAIKKDSIFNKLGIQRGDIIQGANSNAITSPQDAMNLYQSLKAGSFKSLQILRNDRPIILDFSRS